MSKSTLSLLRILLWGLGLFLVFAAAIALYLSLRYSPTYLVREWFSDMGSSDDYLTLPNRPLTASPQPFEFKSNPAAEAQVRAAFQEDPEVPDLEAFLADTGSQAFLVLQDDTILYERYFNGFARDSLVTSFSVAKSFGSALIGLAIADGYIVSAEDPITIYLPELLERDPRFAEIQIRHLLMMASGLRYVDDKPFSTGDGSLTYGFDDLRHLALTETEIVEPPGQTFLYNNYNPLLLGLILERATGRPVTTYLQEKLWTPLGMAYDGSWSLDSAKSGFEKMESGLNARAIDFAKFGRLYLNGGNWEGQQLIPADWAALTTANSGVMQDPEVYYGYMWWGLRCRPDSTDAIALGDHGQFIYVSSAKNLVIVRNGGEWGLEDEFPAWAKIFCRFTQAFD